MRALILGNFLAFVADAFFSDVLEALDEFSLDSSLSDNVPVLSLSSSAEDSVASSDDDEWTFAHHFYLPFAFQPLLIFHGISFE